MKSVLKDDYEAFLSSYAKPPVSSLRFGRKAPKTLEPALMETWHLERVPFDPHGYYYPAKLRPGLCVYHDAGAFYIQEASAMAPANALAPRPFERVLDLCASPGGKSVQLSHMMDDKGILFSNEIIPKRAGILSENIERMGITNTIVTNESPGSLCKKLPKYFDKILVDAPCSGEGMMRKNENAISQWSLKNVDNCSARQGEILECADRLLKDDGRIVYSTCTFEKKENEVQVENFLKKHPEYRMVKLHTIYPHREKGEGQFYAVLERGYVKSDADEGGLLNHDFPKSSMPPQTVRFGDNIYLLPHGAPSLKGLKVMRPGLHAQVIKKNRTEPAHAWGMSRLIDGEEPKVILSEEDALRYVHGESLRPETPTDNGWHVVFAGGVSLGVGKVAGGILKNHYPKGLRRP